MIQVGKKRHELALLIVGLMFRLLLVGIGYLNTVEPGQIFEVENLNFSLWTTRGYDKPMDIGGDVSTRDIAYLEKTIEYPPVSTYLFTLLSVISDHTCLTFMLTSQFYKIIMDTVASIVVYRLIPEGLNRKLAFLAAFSIALMPMAFHALGSGHDNIPAFLTLLSIYFLLREKVETSLCLLAVAYLTKWYPIFLFPLFLKHIKNQHPKKLHRGILSFLLVTSLFSLPFLVSNPTLTLTHILSPIGFHGQRWQNDFSLPGLIAFLVWGNPEEHYDTWPFTILLILTALLPLTLNYRRGVSLVGGCTITVLGCLIFSKIYSPHFISWATYLLLILVTSMWDLALIWALYTVAYVEYPLFLYYRKFRHWRWGGLWYWGGVIWWIALSLRFIILITILVLIYRRVKNQKY